MRLYIQIQMLPVGWVVVGGDRIRQMHRHDTSTQGVDTIPDLLATAITTGDCHGQSFLAPQEDPAQYPNVVTSTLQVMTRPDALVDGQNTSRVAASHASTLDAQSIRNIHVYMRIHLVSSLVPSDITLRRQTVCLFPGTAASPASLKFSFTSVCRD